MAGLINQVHIIAQSYGWTESEILRLPNNRRVSYCDKIVEDAKRQR